MIANAFDPLRALTTLHRREVRFILIGGLAARVWGSPTLTNDTDICYARDRQNLEALAKALDELGARLRGVPEDVRFVADARTLAAGDHFTFITEAGNLDCFAFPAGSGGFDKLNRTAFVMELEGYKVRVAAMEDLIRMKREAGRPKDLIEVEVLSALLQEREQGRGKL